jgi:hypothetical protein
MSTGRSPLPSVERLPSDFPGGRTCPGHTAEDFEANLQWELGPLLRFQSRGYASITLEATNWGALRGWSWNRER